MSDNIEYIYGDRSLRWYQIASINEIADHLNNGIRRVLNVQPTGCGKTLTFAAGMSNHKLRAALGKSDTDILTILFVSHKHVLLTQGERTFIGENNIKLIPQSMMSPIPDDIEYDLVVIDEAHHEACNSFQYQLDQIGNQPIIGLTATPDRSDGLLIKFERIVEPLTRHQAVKEGYLAETDLLTFVDSNDRDKTEITKSIIDDYSHNFGQMIMFFRTKKEAIAINEYLLFKGLKSVALINQSKKQTQKVLDDFGKKKFQILVNCSKVDEGVDVAGCDSVFLGKQYGSYSQLNQVIGRAARPDSACRVWELINPLNANNLDTTIIVGEPKSHLLIHKYNNSWIEKDFPHAPAEETFLH